MSNLDSIPGMKLAQKYIDGSITDNWPVVPEVDKHELLFNDFRVEQAMGERAAERAEFYRDMERELDCA